MMDDLVPVYMYIYIYIFFFICVPICSHEGGVALPAGGGAIIEEGDANRQHVDLLPLYHPHPGMIWGALGIDPAYIFAM